MKAKEEKNWQDDLALKRFKIIQPLLDRSLDPAKKAVLRKKTAEDNDISVRTLRRWEAAFFQSGFAGLRPQPKTGYMSSRLPENFPELFTEAAQLRREVPQRSVYQIIYILENEGKVKPGILKRSTLQRYLFDVGLGEKHLRMYKQDEQSTMTRRFCKPHRMMLVQADIKYGVGVMVDAEGKKKTAYLSSIIDDHSRYLLWSEWYESQDEYCVEDVFRKAILKNGKFDKAYTDNGSQYISRQLEMSCGMLGIKLTRAKIRSGKSKGKIEKFHQVADSFIAEVKLKKVMDINELNRWWKIFVEEYYHNKPHKGIEEYYNSKGITVPEGGISPLQEWNRDTRPLMFLDVKAVAQAFRHHEIRNVDKGGLISFKGRKYEAGAQLIRQQVTISYDPQNDTVITIEHPDITPFEAKPVTISAQCAVDQVIPQAIAQPPVSSRFLDLLEKKHNDSQEKLANAISYGSYRKGE